MRAAILKAPGILELDDIPDPKCPKGGALVRVEACSVCGTDVKMLQNGHRDLVYPPILGHEIVGTIVEIDQDHRACFRFDTAWRGHRRLSIAANR